ncbi:MAG: SHOCT domain-containing protein [Hyphomicrobiaceae bacterium]
MLNLPGFKVVRLMPACVAMLSFVQQAAAQPTNRPRYEPMMHDGWYGWFVGPIMMMVFLVITGIVVVSIVRWLMGPGHGPHGFGPVERSPLDILKERYARGEIDKDEFDERRKVLRE